MGVAALVLGVACASTAQEAQRPSALTPAEIARLTELSEVAERVRLAYGAGCVARPCVPRLVVAEELQAVAVWDGPGFRIWLQRRALGPGVEPRPAVAHEMSHWLLGHTEQDCATKPFECETAANAEAVQVLITGWALTREEAISLIYASLMAGLNRSQPLRGHDTPCREVAVFAQAFNRPLPACQ